MTYLHRHARRLRQAGRRGNREVGQGRAVRRAEGGLEQPGSNVARFFGDNTAWQFSRVTLNPFKHIDPVGTILMPALLS